MNQNENFDGGFGVGKEEQAPVTPAPATVPPKKKKEYTVSLPLTILIVLLTALLTFQTTFVTLSIKHNLEMAEVKAAINKFKVLEEAYELFGDEYIYSIDIDTLVDDMLHAFNAQDKYSAYYSYEEYLAMVAGSQGSAKGIGVYVSGTETAIVVTYVMPGAPAERAGVLAGDEIIAVNGVSVADVGYNAAVNMVAGENGTPVILKIVRDGKEMDITVTRGDYTPYTVIHSLMEENGEKIGYVKIIQFDSITVSQFKTAVEDLKAKGCEKFIFDLRGNPGGELNAVVSMLDYLLPEGPIVHILDADKNETEVYNSDASEVTGEMIVLADGNTASAGELFTSALRDYDKATIIGTKTYGKGCGQSFHPLSNGGFITVTSFYYNPPYGENYDGVGIYPDIEVQLPKEYQNKNTLMIPQGSDTQLAAAISELTK